MKSNTEARKQVTRHEPTVERENLILALLTTAHGWSKVDGVSMRCATKVVLSPPVAHDGTIHAVFNKTGRFVSLEVGRDCPFTVSTTVGDPADVVATFVSRFDAWAQSIGATFAGAAAPAEGKTQESGGELVQAPDADRRGWLTGLRAGDRVEVPYTPAREDLKLMTVYENDGVWIRLLPDGFASEIDNTILANAVSGVLHYAPVQIVPPGTSSGMSADRL